MNAHPFILSLFASAVLVLPALAEETVVDFEGPPSDLDKWAAGGPMENGQSGGKQLARWTTPFTVSLNSESPHSGSNSLHWAFSEDASAPVSLSFRVPASGTDLGVSFFARMTDTNCDGLFSISEFDASGQRTSVRWGLTKIPQSGDWAEVTWTGKVAPGTAEILLTFSFKTMPGGANVWLDDIKVAFGGAN